MLIGPASGRRRRSGVFLALGQLFLRRPVGTQTAFVVKLEGLPRGRACSHSPGKEVFNGVNRQGWKAGGKADDIRTVFPYLGFPWVSVQAGNGQ